MVAVRSGTWKLGITPRPRPDARERDQAVRLPWSVWAELLADAETVAAYHANVYRRGPGEHWPWLGAISSSGHAKMRVPRRLGNRVVAALPFGWQVSRGRLRPGPDGRLPVVRHRCDEASCMNPAHWTTGTKAENAADYEARKDDPLSPLADRRGPAGRARAIRDAVVEAVARGANPQDMGKAIDRAATAGIAGVQDQLF
jgi:hypothetical protein